MVLAVVRHLVERRTGIDHLYSRIGTAPAVPAPGAIGSYTA